jgi:KaiC/GvpD/RAD55 family RecA-like ATPase
MMERVKTGVDGLDPLVEGGLPKKSVTLVSGPREAGRPSFVISFSQRD